MQKKKKYINILAKGQPSTINKLFSLINQANIIFQQQKKKRTSYC